MRDVEHPLFGFDEAEAKRRADLARTRREPGMRCPKCNSEHMFVTDSRGVENGRMIRRRRQCRACGERFSTHEVIFGSSEAAVNERVVRRAKRLLITLMEKLEDTDEAEVPTS